MTGLERRRELTRRRVERWRARKAGLPEPPERIATHCSVCGARLSRYAPRDATTCAVHEPATLTHETYLDAVTQSRADAIPKCKRGHDLEAHGIITNRGGGVMRRVCGACKRERDAGYDRSRRAA